MVEASWCAPRGQDLGLEPGLLQEALQTRAAHFAFHLKQQQRGVVARFFLFQGANGKSLGEGLAATVVAHEGDPRDDMRAWPSSRRQMCPPVRALFAARRKRHYADVTNFVHAGVNDRGGRSM